jgi:outer membrane protein assembly factor BamE (lipoprotein component of BamABCDE complex)
MGLILFRACVAFPWWSVESHPVSKRKMAKLRVGMPATEVREILGRPRKEEQSDSGAFAWLYGSKLQWYYFSVRFSTSSNVVEFLEDD